MLGRMILAAGLAVTLAAPASAQNCAFVYPYSTLGGICAEIQEQQAIHDSERLNDRLEAARRAQSEELDRSLREADQQRAIQEMSDGQASAMQEMRGTVAAMESREVDAQSARIDRADREDADRSDSDRSNRGSGHSEGPCDAPTSQRCLEPDPRNPSGPAVDRTAHKGRTHDRNRPDPSQLLKILATAGAVHTWVPAFAGNAVKM